MKHKRIFFLLVACCSGFSVFASQIDSLKGLLKTNLSEYNRIVVLNDLSYAYNEFDPGLALYYAQEACKLSDELNNLKGKKKSYGQLGTAYLSMGDHAKAIECYIKCAGFAEKLNDDEGQSSSYHNIGVLYKQLDRKLEAKKYVGKALEIDKKLGDKYNYGITCNTYGAICLDMGDTLTALRYFEESYKSFIAAGKPEYSAPSVSNIAHIHKSYKRYDKALTMFRLSIEYYTRTEMPVRAANAMRSMADIYFTQGKIDEAIYYFEESFRLYSGVDTDDYNIRQLFEGMSKAYSQKRNFEKAYHSLLRAYDILKIKYDESDSLRNESIDSIFAEMATKYETEKKEKELKIKNLEIEKNEKEKAAQRTTIIFSVLGMILLSGLLVVVINSNRKTRAANVKINLQKKEIEKQRDEITVKNQEITSSIEYAKTLQDAILPDEKFITKSLPEHFILWWPRDIVSGDFYWFYERSGKIFFAVADCTGHGVPGAFVSMTCHNVLNQVVIDQKIESPGEILSRVHRIVSNVFHREGSLSQSNDGMDIVICCIEKEKTKLSFAGAMNPLVQVRNNEVTEHKADRMAIGGKTPHGFEFANNEIHYLPGDWFYMYSDGYQDQFGGPNGKKFMSSNFKKLLSDISHLPHDRQKDKLKKTLLEWQKGYDRIDDVLVTGFKV